MLNNHTALGRRPDGAIIAPFAFWKKETRGNFSWIIAITYSFQWLCLHDCWFVPYLFCLFLCVFQKKPECKKFMYGVPTYVDQLGEMFHGVTVDGSTSCIPGQESIDPEECVDEEGEDADGEGFMNSPMSSNSRKRASNSTSTATSPPKESKSPMLTMFQGCLKS